MRDFGIFPDLRTTVVFNEFHVGNRIPEMDDEKKIQI